MNHLKNVFHVALSPYTKRKVLDLYIFLSIFLSFSFFKFWSLCFQDTKNNWHIVCRVYIFFHIYKGIFNSAARTMEDMLSERLSSKIREMPKSFCSGVSETCFSIPDREHPVSCNGCKRKCALPWVNGNCARGETV